MVGRIILAGASRDCAQNEVSKTVVATCQWILTVKREKLTSSQLDIYTENIRDA
jgi:hypothetical protein